MRIIRSWHSIDEITSGFMLVQASKFWGKRFHRANSWDRCTVHLWHKITAKLSIAINYCSLWRLMLPLQEPAFRFLSDKRQDPPIHILKQALTRTLSLFKFLVQRANLLNSSWSFNAEVQNPFSWFSSFSIEKVRKLKSVNSKFTILRSRLPTSLLSHFWVADVHLPVRA